MDHASLPLSYDMLKEITNDFAEERLLGSGGYGRVYKGVHKDGKIIAVKLLYDMPGLDDEQFKREFNNLTNLQHNNIVRLVGYCHETRPECVQYNGRMVVADKIHRALCFEYAHNGSLHENLFDEYNGLDWHTRYGIIKGICSGLKYLHQELKPPMYHLDIKPANVLLDENMLPKVADFGLSRLFGEEQTKITKSSIGTCGYIPPEYIEKHVLSNKFDIFSLGVVIIKVMAGPLGYSRCGNMSSHEFVKLVHGNWRDRLQATSMYEPEPYFIQVKTCIEIALRCVEADRHKRPSIRDIVDKLIETETMIRLWSPLQVDGNWRARLQEPPIFKQKPEAYYEQVKTCIQIAFSCMEANRHKRPNTSNIVDKMNETETKTQLSSPIEKKIPLASRYFYYGAKGINALRLFEYNDLAAATDRFSMDNTLGEGGFGTVYKGSYTDEYGKQEVAVRTIKHITAEDGDFLAALQRISGKTRHMNIVKLKGWCCNRKTWNLIDFMSWFRQQTVPLFLVYEFVPNGNLDDHLHHREKFLPWEKRYQIVKGIGSALKYLHHECNELILHCDIKPSNILLDYDFNAKLADLELSTIARQDPSCPIMLLGTLGCRDPEFFINGLYSRKSDVYSFGIVLLKIACTDKSREQVLELYRHSATEKVMEYSADPKLCGVFDRMEMARVIVLGLKCSHPDMEQRPYMVDVMKFLEDDIIELPAITEIEGHQGASAITEIEDGIVLELMC